VRGCDSSKIRAKCTFEPSAAPSHPRTLGRTLAPPHLRTLALFIVVIALFIVSAAGQTPRTIADGVYTDAQAARGGTTYGAQCAACHGAALGGGLAPPLAGAAFLRAWDGQPLIELVEKIQKTMPATSPGTLSRAQAVDITAYLLKAGAFRAGAVDLPADDTLESVAFVAPPGTVPTTPPPPGNLAQVMRGILFPSSNLIFNVQNQDPGQQKMGWQPGDTPFGWADWGAGIYSGWELVDYAAISIAEAAPLLLTPGRRCENGRPAPVDRADWIQFTKEMADAGRSAYRASQSRDRDAVIEVTNAIADACLRCHEVYRDKPGGTTVDPSNKAARCLP
jgi:mono/diheme cytochrome c family protein